jgi:uncharacterized protein YndB with AHSA1/START domain
MPSFQDAAVSPAPPEEVWKALYDPARFPEWWVGVGTVEVEPGSGRYTMFPEGYPDFPMPQLLDARSEQGRVVVSCQVSDLVFAYALEPLADGGTRIAVHVDIPESEGHRLDGQREAIGASLRRLAALAAETG